MKRCKLVILMWVAHLIIVALIIHFPHEMDHFKSIEDLNSVTFDSGVHILGLTSLFKEMLFYWFFNGFAMSVAYSTSSLGRYLCLNGVEISKAKWIIGLSLGIIWLKIHMPLTILGDFDQIKIKWALYALYVFPHGIFELSAIFLAMAKSWEQRTTIGDQLSEKTGLRWLIQQFKTSLYKSCWVLILLAGFIEAYLTPRSVDFAHWLKNIFY